MRTCLLWFYISTPFESPPSAHRISLQELARLLIIPRNAPSLDIPLQFFNCFCLFLFFCNAPAMRIYQNRMSVSHVSINKVSLILISALNLYSLMLPRRRLRSSDCHLLYEAFFYTRVMISRRFLGPFLKIPTKNIFRAHFRPLFRLRAKKDKNLYRFTQHRLRKTYFALHTLFRNCHLISAIF